METYKELKDYLATSAVNLKSKLREVNIKELAEKLITYEGDGGCAAAGFYNLIGDYPEIVNNVVSAVVDNLESKLESTPKSIDFGMVTQHVFAWLSGQAQKLDKNLQKRLYNILENKNYLHAILTKNFKDAFLYEHMICSNYRNARFLFKNLSMNK